MPRAAVPQPKPRVKNAKRRDRRKGRLDEALRRNEAAMAAMVQRSQEAEAMVGRVNLQVVGQGERLQRMENKDAAPLRPFRFF